MTTNKLKEKQRLAQELINTVLNDRTFRVANKPAIENIDGKDRITLATEAKRSNKRFTSPSLKITINGSSWFTADWSLSGVKLMGFSQDIKLQTLHEATITYGNKCMSVKVKVQWKKPDKRELGLVFTEMSSTGWDFLSKLGLGKS